MKTLFILLLLGLATCDKKYFTYKKGKLQQGNEAAAEIFGHLEIMQTGKNNYVELNGLYLGGAHKPFAFIMTEPKMDPSGAGLSGECKSGAWDLEHLKLTGKYTITLADNVVKFEGLCTNTETKLTYKIDFVGNSTKCLVYQAPEAADRAKYLIGEKASHFRPSHVLNFVYYDYPFLDVMKNCRFYLTKFGKEEPSAKPGYAIVGKDGMHCGVLDNEGNKFIHTNPAKKEVTLTSIALADTFFKNGYVFKSVPCDGPHGY